MSSNATNLTKQKVLMGTQFEVPVELATYGGAIAKVHALSDLDLARIEHQTGYSLIEALKAIEKAGLADQDVNLSSLARDDPSQAGKISHELLTPQFVMFLGELVKAGLVRGSDPECNCKGQGCPKCAITDEDIEHGLKGFSIMALGLAVIGASLADWKDTETFFSAKKG